MATQESKASERSVDSPSVNPQVEATPPENPGAALVPNLDLPVSETVTYQSLVVTESVTWLGPDRGVVESPLDFLGIEASGQDAARPPRQPLEGVLLTHQQAWRTKGITLGNLLHSLCLAPGEVTRLSISDWGRRTHASSSLSSQAGETSRESATRSRDTSEITRAVAKESTSGFTTSRSEASQASGSVSGVMGLWGGSASGGTNSATASSATFGSSSRTLTQDINAKVRQATHRHAAKKRQESAALVQEFSETETETLSTRIVANYNHMHALNMQYYEVIQVFELSTHVTGAERCLFLPMEPITFDPTSVSQFAVSLAEIAWENGMTALATGVVNLWQGHIDADSRIQALEKERDAADAAYEATLETREKAKHAEGQAWRRNSDAHGRLKAARQAKAGAEEIAKLRKEATNTTKAYEVAIAAQQATLGPAKLAGETRTEARQALSEAKQGAALDVDKICELLNASSELFNQALWRRMSPAQITAMLGTTEYPAGRALVEHLEPTVVGITGDYVAFRWPFKPKESQEAERFHERYVEEQDVADSELIALPTGGIFAEAVLGQANSAEKLDMTRYWKWDEDSIPILPPEIGPIQQQSHQRMNEARPAAMAPSSLHVQALADERQSPGRDLAAALGRDLFRDITGADAIAALLQSSQGDAAELSNEAQQAAHETVKAYVAHLKEMLPITEQLMTRGGTLDPSSAGALANSLGMEGEVDPNKILARAAKLGVLP